MADTELGTEVTVEELPDLNDTPPCMTVWRHPNPHVPDYLCGKPSVVRVRYACNACGARGVNFICAECLQATKDRNLACPVCFVAQRPGMTTNYTYQET